MAVIPGTPGNSPETLRGTGDADIFLGDDSNELMFGGAGNDQMFGGAGNDYLEGGTGDDLMFGGVGNDGYVVDSLLDRVFEGANQGEDYIAASISYSLEDLNNVENLYLSAATNANLDGTGNNLDNIVGGNQYNNVLKGLSGNDRLLGREGDDTLDGGTGNDDMDGGMGDDTFIVDSLGDRVTERALEGFDTVRSTISYTLGDHVEQLFLEGNSDINGIGNSLNNKIVGNAGRNRLFGYEGHDVLEGGEGADILEGGLGDDSFVSVDGLDTIVELANEGTDTVYMPVDYTLGANLENLALFRTAVRGTGNSLDNVITGNRIGNVNNILEGAEGNDELIGLAGDDFLDGGVGNDRMVGGVGNDTYVYTAGDTIVEAANEGTDTVLSSTDYTLGANLENLTLTGTATKGTGNASNNVITGNAINNLLEGAEGNDELIGLAGDDFLDGGAGSDRMVGGVGNDTYIYTVGDTLVEAANEGTDTVLSNSDYTLGANLENLTLTGTASKGTGNALSNMITGNAAANILDGGAGIDILIGGLGDDTYIVSDAADSIVEAANAGTDTVIASTSHTLGANVENLIMSDAGKTRNSSTMKGNDLNNMLVGNAGANTMSGGAGKDTLISGGGRDIVSGGKGADRFVFSSRLQGGDRVLDFSRQERDVLVFEAPGFRGLKAGKLKASQFVLGNKALDKGDRFIYDQRRGTLSYDSDGLGGAKQTLVATFTTKPSLTARDFVITATSSF